MIRDEDVALTTLAARAVPTLIPLRRDLFWRGLQDLGPPEPSDVWVQLRNQSGVHPDSPLFEDTPREGETFTLFALFAPHMGLTVRLREVFHSWKTDYDASKGRCLMDDGKVAMSTIAPSRRAFHCELEDGLIMAAIHLFLGVRWRKDAIALDLNILDKIHPDLRDLPQRRRQLMRDYGLGKVRPATTGWESLDRDAAWSWGQVRWVYMLLRPSQQLSTVESRAGNFEGLALVGHWVLVVYDRQVRQVMIYDSKEYLKASDRSSAIRQVRNILVDYGVFSTKLVIDPIIGWEKRMEVILTVPEEPVRIAYSQRFDWECGQTVIRMARVLLEGQALWNDWASPDTKAAGPGRLTTDFSNLDYETVTVPQSRYARTLLRSTMADLSAYLEGMDDLWDVIKKEPL